MENTAASEETLRLIVEAAAGGGEGIVAPADLRVSALDVPAAGVQVATGAMILAAGNGRLAVVRRPHAHRRQRGHRAHRSRRPPQ
ncbi:hypothetical protein LUR56_40205 [Streptomyces sp. MT29]|nr:hypothetical protein [Streptomyces sp. MT29]